MNGLNMCFSAAYLPTVFHAVQEMNLKMLLHFSRRFRFEVMASVCLTAFAGCGGQREDIGGGTTVNPSTKSGLSLVAGTLGGSGNTDGVPGRFALFYGTGGIAVDIHGTVYVSDADGSTIRRISASGAVTTLAGVAGKHGYFDGVGSEARFGSAGGIGSLVGMAVDNAATVYLADANNNTIRKITADGVVTTLGGVAGSCGSTDGTLAMARFCAPGGLALDATGSLYVADNYRLIRKISPDGVVTTVAGTLGLSPQDGVGTAAGFARLAGLAVDRSGTIFAIDDRSVRKITIDGVVTTLAGTRGVNGTGDGVGAEAKFNSPDGIAVDNEGNVFVADTLNNTIRKITPTGFVTTLAGRDMTAGAFADGAGQTARFSGPLAIAVNHAGTLFVTDNQNNAIRSIFQDGVVTTLAGKASSPGAIDGAGVSAKFAEPSPASHGFDELSAVGGIAVDNTGNIFVADTGNDLIRKITHDGLVTTLAGIYRGSSTAAGSVDGIGSAARFNAPEGVTIDKAGNVFIADTGSHVIRKIDNSGRVTTYAGMNGVSGHADGSASNSRFCSPSGIASDSDGNVYVADLCNNVVRQITALGVVSTLAGNPGSAGSTDGPRTSALLLRPSSVAVDRLGNLYVTEGGFCAPSPHRPCPDVPHNKIRRISVDGNVTTIKAAGVSSDTLFTNVAVDRAGSLYVTDTGNSVIVKLGPDGAVTTVAGKGGSFGVVIGDLPGSLNRPIGIAVDSTGVLYTMSENSVLKLQMQ